METVFISAVPIQVLVNISAVPIKVLVNISAVPIEVLVNISAVPWAVTWMYFFWAVTWMYFFGLSIKSHQRSPGGVIEPGFRQVV